MEAERTQVYLCPRCAMDTPHLVVAERKSVLAVLCSHCRTASLVKKEILADHHNRWEQELREILDSLTRKPDDER